MKGNCDCRSAQKIDLIYPHARPSFCQNHRKLGALHIAGPTLTSKRVVGLFHGRECSRCQWQPGARAVCRLAIVWPSHLAMVNGLNCYSNLKLRTASQPFGPVLERGVGWVGYGPNHSYRNHVRQRPIVCQCFGSLARSLSLCSLV